MRNGGSIALFVFALASVPTASLGWGPPGHRIAAAIAADNLSPRARAEVERLLRGEAHAAMMAVSMWADDIGRDRPETTRWHFVDIPIGSSGYDARRDCPNSDCVVAQIERDARMIADRQLPTRVRAEALMFLVHLVVDLHQPMHAADNGDRGGTEIKVVLGRDRTATLHGIWDNDVVRALGRRVEDTVARLESEISPAQRDQWRRGDVADWANETFRLASREIYANLDGINGSRPILLPPDYAQRERQVTETQLEKAGVRLAAILNAQLR